MFIINQESTGVKLYEIGYFPLKVSNSINVRFSWGEPERAPHCCKFSIYMYRTSCRKSLPALILRIYVMC